MFICRVLRLLNQKAGKVHCVYMPDAILSICRMVVLFKQEGSDSALCLDAGCHSVYMPDVISG